MLISEGQTNELTRADGGGDLFAAVDGGVGTILAQPANQMDVAVTGSTYVTDWAEVHWFLDTTRPTVISTLPANAATGVAINSKISATFSEAMTALTASFGIAVWRADDSVDALFGRADRALYQAKRLGRDRTELG